MDWDRRTQTGARTSGVEKITSLMVVHHRAHCPDTAPDVRCGNGVCEGQMQTVMGTGYARCRLDLNDMRERRCLKGQPSSRTAGKLTVRNDRGGGGNVGIIRSPL